MSLFDREHEGRIRSNLSAAQEPIRELARDLMRAAFQERTARGSEISVIQKMTEPEFQPAPLYLEQASVLNSSPELRRRVIEALQMMDRRQAT